MINLEETKEMLLVLKAKRTLLNEEFDRISIDEEYWRNRKENSIKAREILQQVAQSTQKNIEEYLSSIVTLALKAIPFDEDFNFKIEFVIKRGKTEAEIYLMNKDGEKIKPTDSTGGGVCDIASLALRMAFWSLRRTRPVMILDEPLKFLSAEFQGYASSMLKMLSEKLDLQIIMVSHNEEIIKEADNVIWI